MFDQNNISIGRLFKSVSENLKRTSTLVLFGPNTTLSSVLGQKNQPVVVLMMMMTTINADHLIVSEILYRFHHSSETSGEVHAQRQEQYEVQDMAPGSVDAV